jgi:predicted NAD/FAD-binding protein
MKIAIIGSGISGMLSGYLLSRKHEITLFEANSLLGGHTHTRTVTVPSGDYAVDTGFIVFNDWTYPNFIHLMNQIGVTWKDSSMSFSVRSEKSGLEYNGTSIDTLFAQRSNLLRPSFYRMIRDILKFNQESLQVLDWQTSPTLGEFLRSKNYSSQFCEDYILPMGASIWSGSPEQILSFPIKHFVRFFKNHGMLSVDDRPVWKVILGGSSSYIEPLTRSFRSQIRVHCPVQRVRRSREGAEVEWLDRTTGTQHQDHFDQVVFACHSDQTQALIADQNPLENQIVSAFKYQPNSVVLHTDIRLLPKNKKAWAAWNYVVPRQEAQSPAVTYNMNILQGIQSPETFCVSLNQDAEIDSKKILARLTYDHPVYSDAAFAAQDRWSEISGTNRYHYCGAYWGFGFHEDGVKSALRVCEQLGVTL